MALSSKGVRVAILLTALVCVCVWRPRTGAPAPKPASARDDSVIADANLGSMSGELRCEPESQGATFRISLVVRMEKSDSITSYVVYCNVYELAGTQDTPFRDITQSLGVSYRSTGTYHPPRFEAENTEFTISQVKLKMPEAKGTTYIVSMLAVIRFSTGQKAICRFDPVAFVGGKPTPAAHRPQEPAGDKEKVSTEDGENGRTRDGSNN